MARNDPAGAILGVVILAEACLGFAAELLWLSAWSHRWSGRSLYLSEPSCKGESYSDAIVRLVAMERGT